MNSLLKDATIKYVKIFRGKRIFGLPLIFLLTFLAYSNIFQNQFVYEDMNFIVCWPLIQDWRNLPRFFSEYSGLGGTYSPLRTFFHAITYHLFGLNTMGYHVFSLLLYFSHIYYGYKIGFLLTRNKTVAFLSNLFFALHPVHAFPIMYMGHSAGGGVGGIFSFMAFYYYIKSSAHLQPVVSFPLQELSFIPSLKMRKGGDEAGGRAKLSGRLGEEREIENLPSQREKKRFYVYALLASCAAIFTYELCVALPVLFLGYDVCLAGENGQCRKIWFNRLILGLRRAGPFLAIALFYILCKYLVLEFITPYHYLYGSFYLTMLVTIKALAKYVFLCLLPLVLTHNHVISPGIYYYMDGSYDFDKFAVLSQSVLDPQVLWSLGVLGGVFYVAVKTWRRHPLVTFCIGWFFISLLPASNIVPRNIYFAEGYVYPGSWWFCLLLGMCCESMLRRQGRWWRRIGVGLISILILFYGIRTWIRNTDLHDNVVLFERAVKATPRNALAHKHLGSIYVINGMFDKARESFDKSLEIQPDDPVILDRIKNDPFLRGEYLFCPDRRFMTEENLYCPEFGLPTDYTLGYIKNGPRSQKRNAFSSSKTLEVIPKFSEGQ